MSAPDRGLEIRMLGGYAELVSMRGAWQSLCDRSAAITPFQRPDWLIPWIRHFGPGEPWIIAARRAGRLVGLAPLFRYGRAHAGERRTLALLGAGISDYLDVLVEPGEERAVLGGVIAELHARRGSWDVCELDELRPGTALLRAGVPPGWVAEAEAASTCPVLPLPARVDALDRHVPGRHLARFHQYRRRAGREGELRLIAADDDGRDALLDALFRLHGARWRDRGQPGVLDTRALRAFHGEVARGFAARGALGLFGLALGSRLIACLYGFFEAGTFHFYLSGLDPDAARLSPGTLILGLVIEEAVRRGMRRFDFLRGSEPYKRWWGAVERGNLRLRLRW